MVALDSLILIHSTTSYCLRTLSTLLSGRQPHVAFREGETHILRVKHEVSIFIYGKLITHAAECTLMASVWHLRSVQPLHCWFYGKYENISHEIDGQTFHHMDSGDESVWLLRSVQHLHWFQKNRCMSR